MPRQRQPLGASPTKAEIEQWLRDSTPEQLQEVRQRWGKADIGGVSVCLPLMLLETAGLPMDKHGRVACNSNMFVGKPTIVRCIHIDALSYVKECGCCGERAPELRMCGGCRLVKYCGRSRLIDGIRHHILCVGRILSLAWKRRRQNLRGEASFRHFLYHVWEHLKVTLPSSTRRSLWLPGQRVAYSQLNGTRYRDAFKERLMTITCAACFTYNSRS